MKFFLVFSLLYAMNSFGGVFKCTDSKGHVVYSDTACSTHAERQKLELSPSETTSESPSFFSTLTEKLKNFFKSSSNYPVSNAEKSSGSAQVSQQRYQCDGRTRCSQMNSCDEATFFINHCPNTEMDGDYDGIPCESQWCQ